MVISSHRAKRAAFIIATLTGVMCNFPFPAVAEVLSTERVSVDSQGGQAN